MWYTVGNEWAIALLQRAVRLNRVAHTYLFTGQEGIGKTHLARYLAAMLNCPGEGPPCGECDSCLHIARDAHPDVLLVRPQEGRLKIDQIREAQHSLSLSPFAASWRVAIITDFQKATPEAANALLKTLEEPASRAVIILTATDPSLLLPTVVSRCQVIALRPVSQVKIEEALRSHWNLDPSRARLLAHLSAGRMGWAAQVASDPNLLAGREKDLQILNDLLAHGRAERIMAAEELAHRDDLAALLLTWQGWWQDVLLLASGCTDYISNLDYVDTMRFQADMLGVRRARAAISSVETALQYIDENVNPRLALEVLLTSWPTFEPAEERK